MTYYLKTWVLDFKMSMSGSTVREDKEDGEEAHADETGKGESAEEDEARSNGKWLYSQFFSLYYGGFYRVLPSDGYGNALAIGYGVDLFLNIIPMVLCQVWTNAEAGVNLTPLMSWAIIIKMFSLISFIFEVLLMICEIRTHKKLQELEVRGYIKPTEPERRAKACRLGVFTGIGSCAFILLIMVIGLAATPGRKCGTGHVLELAVCNKCQRDNCAECESDSRTCSKCNVGFTVVDGKCTDCDSDTSRVICEACNEEGKCAACAEGFRLANGVCERCGDAQDD